MSSAEDPESFASYLAKRFVGEKRFQPAVPEEAALLVEHCDSALSYADLGFVIVCIVDREAGAKPGFSMSQHELLEVGRSCLKYTGSVNGTKMPVSIRIYDVAAGPASDADRARLAALHKSLPGAAKVAITCFHIDTRAKSVWSSAAFNGLLRGRRWIERVLREPRKQDTEIFVPDAALPTGKRRPIATLLLLSFLIGMFVIEQVAKLGDKGAGLFGVDVATLFALGGMNSAAVSKNGEWYRLLSAALLHADAFHLLMNGLALGLSGYLLESLLGPAWLVTLFFLGALGGSLMGLAVNPESLVSVGASGAVMALLAAAFITAMRFPRGATRTQIQAQILQFLIPSLIPLATHRPELRIDFAAHFGGAITGALVGLGILRVWPREAEQPRFAPASRGFALVSLACFALSLFFVQTHYAAEAKAATFASADFLVEDSKIPKDVSLAKRDVDTWGSGHPRDPRVHFFRALKFLDDSDMSQGERELRAALAEREILEQAFSNRKLEIEMRSVLCQLLLQEGKSEEAKSAAAPACKADNGAVPAELRELNVCD